MAGGAASLVLKVTVCATHVAQDLTSGLWEEGVALPPGKICSDGGRGQSGGANRAGRLEARGVALSIEEGGVQASHLAGWREQLFEGPGVCTPGWWEGVLFKDRHLIFIFGCGWACGIVCQEDSCLRVLLLWV